MREQNIFILGGYGAAGGRIARLLLAHSTVNVVVGGHRLDKAKAFADALNTEFGADRARAVFADASDTETLKEAAAAARMIVVASTTESMSLALAKRCLDAGVDYLDMYYGAGMWEKMLPLAPAIQASGRLFLTQGGFHPGMPAVMVRHAAPQFTRLKSASIAMVLNNRLESVEIAAALVRVMKDYRAQVYEGGRWRKAAYRDTIRVDFSPHLRRRQCYPMDLDELHTLPDSLGLERLGCYVAGFNRFVDWVVFPVMMLLGRFRMFEAPLAGLFYWGTNTFFRPPPEVILVIEAEGEADGKGHQVRVSITHEDAYDLTAIPVAACLLQYVDGLLPASGLHFMSHAVDPVRLYSDMQKMGVAISEEMRPL